MRVLCIDFITMNLLLKNVQRNTNCRQTFNLDNQLQVYFQTMIIRSTRGLLKTHLALGSRRCRASLERVVRRRFRARGFQTSL